MIKSWKKFKMFKLKHIKVRFFYLILQKIKNQNKGIDFTIFILTLIKKKSDLKINSYIRIKPSKSKFNLQQQELDLKLAA